ncbi:MAG: hypothetical protein WBP56_20190 [Polyangia bacterium]|jgi:hypothetical protein
MRRNCSSDAAESGLRTKVAQGYTGIFVLAKGNPQITSSTLQ